MRISVRMRPTVHSATARALHQLYLAKGAAATTAIEGNTLSEEEVLKAVEGRLVVPPSKQYLKQEVENIIAACNGISQKLAEGTLLPLSLELLCAYNRQVLEKLPVKDDVKLPTDEELLAAAKEAWARKTTKQKSESDIKSLVAALPAAAKGLVTFGSFNRQYAAKLFVITPSA